jgi:hypothetical protein
MSRQIAGGFGSDNTAIVPATNIIGGAEKDAWKAQPNQYVFA